MKPTHTFPPFAHGSSPDADEGSAPAAEYARVLLGEDGGAAVAGGEPRVGADDEEPTRPRVRGVRELLAAGAGQVDLLVFRLGRERFGVEIAAVEEAVELSETRPVPDAPTTVVGVTDVRGALVTVFSPARALRCAPRADVPVMLVMRDGERRVALAVDDVEDVLVLEPSLLRTPALRNSADDLVLGVVRAGSDLVTVLDPAALVAGCVAAPAEEAA
jgi:purine-binding chemotaxis protein CheW